MLIGDQQRFRHFRVRSKYAIDGFRGAEACATESRSRNALGLYCPLFARKALGWNGRDQCDQGAAYREQTDCSYRGVTPKNTVERAAEPGCNRNERSAGESGQKSGCEREVGLCD
jgi:hypothetical protein